MNAARQSSLLARSLQQQLTRAARDQRLSELPPILTFQSVVDFTVSTRAVVSALYALLPANGSELVIFDINRNAKLGLLLGSSADTALVGLLPEAPRRFRSVIVTNASPESSDVVARITESGATTEQTRALGLVYPRDLFSLSHVAVSVSGQRWRVRNGARSVRGLRRESRSHGRAGRARHADREPRLRESRGVESVLPVRVGADRVRDWQSTQGRC